MSLLALEASRLMAAGTVVLAYLGLCGGIAHQQWRRVRQARRDAAALVPGDHGRTPLLVAHASQTGTAEGLAWQTARALHTAGVPARILPLAEVSADDLRQAERALFIVSTYGEGDPPDTAALFARRLMEGPDPPLPDLHYAVLALGDREYAQFCGFGRRLDAWLAQQGARPLFERIEVDNADPQAVSHWQRQLGRLAGTSDLPDWEQAPDFGRWTLLERRHLNPGSAGRPTFHLELAPAEGAPLPHWAAGDLVQVLAPGDPQRPREYSIASVPADGRIHLLVRQEQRADGQPGIASGWLTGQAEVGGEITMRVREHRHFRLDGNEHRALILVGNGTGLAGLRSHLRARAASRTEGQTAPHHWLLFGERQAAHDAYYRDEIARWQAQGLLTHTDLVYSRDQAGRRYVQDRLRERADTLRLWVSQGAALYVCGSLAGMAAGVEAALEDILGRDMLDTLLAEGRYRRDVY